MDTEFLPPGFLQALDQALDDWQATGKSRRLWDRDPDLWTGNDEAHWLDWLDVVRSQRESSGIPESVAGIGEGRDPGHLVLLGMGGSSMAPEVIAAVIGSSPGKPDLLVLDSTDPAQVQAVDDVIDPANTLFLVASKSGSTLEPNALKAWFFQRVSATLGREKAASRFIAVTDPGSSLERVARSEGFREVFYGRPGIGGRFSALSAFGLVPAMAIGVDVERLLGTAAEMVEACAAGVPARENPGVVLGCVLGVSANLGRDKVTILASPGIAPLGAWLEQLLAESTGKQGKGLIPVDGEAPAPPGVYGNDRLFVYLCLDGDEQEAQADAVSALEQAGQPVVRIRVPGPYYLGQEFFRWEFATAVAGTLIGVNAFDQPDVEASKRETRKLTDEYESSGGLPGEVPLAEQAGITLYTSEHNAAELRALSSDTASVAELIRAHLQRTRAGDYIALLAYIARNEAHFRELQGLRHRLRDARHVATCVGFGPRFLHSTGQVYKGGPNTGVFLQITCEDAHDLPVPGHEYTFGVIKAAQARGDFQVLVDRGRRALRVHLDGDLLAGLRQLTEIVDTVTGV